MYHNKVLLKVKVIPFECQAIFHDVRFKALTMVFLQKCTENSQDDKIDTQWSRDKKTIGEKFVFSLLWRWLRRPSAAAVI